MLDTFERTDTAPGTIGGPDFGPPWAITGAGIGDAQVVDGRFVTTAQTTYIYQKYDRRPLRIGGTVSWVQGEGADPGFGALISSYEAALIENMVHFIFSNTSWTLHVREAAGDFEVLATGTYDVPVDGSPHDVEMRFDGNSVILTTPDGVTQEPIADARISALSGGYNTWEIRNTDASTLIRWDEAVAWRAP